MMLSDPVQDVETFVVISKIPSEYRDPAGSRQELSAEQERYVKDDILQQLQLAEPGFLSSQLFLLHLDPFLMYREQLPIPLIEDRHSTRGPLVKDYLDLFEALLHKRDRKSFRKHFQEHLKKEFQEIRVFRLLREKGLLINPNDESRNVAMRADTLGSLMQILAEGEDGVDQKLFGAGLKAAAKFTEALVDMWDSEPTTRRLEHPSWIVKR